MPTHSKRALLANTFGSLGYLSSVLLWAWTGLLFVPMLLENQTVEKFLLPEPHETIIVQPSSTATSPLMITIALAVTIVVVLVTIVVLLRMPVAIARTGQTVTTKAAATALPIVTRGHKLPAKQKRRLTSKLIKLTKLLLIILPVAIGFIGVYVETPITFQLAILISSVLAMFSLVLFSLQYITAHFLAIDDTLLV